MRVPISYVIVLLILSSALVAAESMVEVTPINNKIQLTGQASFELRITNGAFERQQYSIHSVLSGIGWNVEPEPLQDRIITLDHGKSRTTKIIVSPLESFEPGIYTIPLSIRTNLGESYDEQLKIFINPDRPLDYLPAIKATVDMDEKITSTDPFSITLFVENRNPLDLKNITVRIQSDIPSFEQSTQIDIPPLGEKTVEFTVTPDPTTQPKAYVLFFVFEKDGQVVKVIEQNIEILPYIPAFDVSVSESRALLKKLKSVNVTNRGNVRNSQQVSIPLSFMESLFTQPRGKRITVDGERHLAWELTLSPGETIVLPVQVNYRLPFYILIVLILISIIYLSLRSPIKINKSVMSVQRHEGTLTELKVKLNIRNLTGRTFKNVGVVDKLPGIAHIERALEMGTVRPVKVTHSSKGAKVHWELPELEGHEDRLITYKIKSRLNIVGTLQLPRAVVQFHKGKKKWTAYSNTFSVSSKT